MGAMKPKRSKGNPVLAILSYLAFAIGFLMQLYVCYVLAYFSLLLFPHLDSSSLEMYFAMVVFFLLEILLTGLTIFAWKRVGTKRMFWSFYVLYLGLLLLLIRVMSVFGKTSL